eukprot:scaffold134597_cov18-Tisochrysis_lutea.AAC.4
MCLDTSWSGSAGLQDCLSLQKWERGHSCLMQETCVRMRNRDGLPTCSKHIKESQRPFPAAVLLPSLAFYEVGVVSEVQKMQHAVGKGRAQE